MVVGPGQCPLYVMYFLLSPVLDRFGTWTLWTLYTTWRPQRAACTVWPSPTTTSSAEPTKMSYMYGHQYWSCFVLLKTALHTVYLIQFQNMSQMFKFLLSLCISSLVIVPYPMLRSSQYLPNFTKYPMVKGIMVLLKRRPPSFQREKIATLCFIESVYIKNVQ